MAENESRQKDSQFVNAERFHDTIKGIVKLEVGSFVGSGFLSRSRENQLGIYTNNHVLLKSYYINHGLTIKVIFEQPKEPRPVFIEAKVKSFFTDEELDVSFFALDGQVAEYVESQGYVYTLSDQKIEKKQKIQVLQHPRGGKMHYTEGVIQKVENRHFDIKHDASTLPGSSGSPILDYATLKVIGIHKKGGELNGGTKMQTVIEKMADRSKWIHDVLRIIKIYMVEETVSRRFKEGAISSEDITNVAKAVSDVAATFAMELGVGDKLDDIRRNAMLMGDSSVVIASKIFKAWLENTTKDDRTYATLFKVLVNCSKLRHAEEICYL